MQQKRKLLSLASNEDTKDNQTESIVTHNEKETQSKNDENSEQQDEKKQHSEPSSHEVSLKNSGQEVKRLEVEIHNEVQNALPCVGALINTIRFRKIRKMTQEKISLGTTKTTTTVKTRP